MYPVNLLTPIKIALNNGHHLVAQKIYVFSIGYLFPNHDKYSVEFKDCVHSILMAEYGGPNEYKKIMQEISSHSATDTL